MLTRMPGQDTGNVNFTFVSPIAIHDPMENGTMVAEVLRECVY